MPSGCTCLPVNRDSAFESSRSFCSIGRGNIMFFPENNRIVSRRNFSGESAFTVCRHRCCNFFGIQNRIISAVAFQRDAGADDNRSSLKRDIFAFFPLGNRAFEFNQIRPRFFLWPLPLYSRQTGTGTMTKLLSSQKTI